MKINEERNQKSNGGAEHEERIPENEKRHQCRERNDQRKNAPQIVKP